MAGPVRGLALFGLLLLLPGAAPAHDTWLLPRSVTSQPGQQIVLDLTSGMRFPALESAIQPDRIARAAIRCNAKDAEIRDRKAAKSALALSTEVPESGIAAIWVETRPKDIELKPEQVKEYLEEIGAWDTVGRVWERSGSKRWREVYTKHSKTFVRIGDPGDDRSWGEPVGMDLEIVPEKDPTTLAVGDDLSVRVLLDGRPLPDLSVGFAPAEHKSGATRKTDAAGRASVRVDRAGWWLIKGTLVTASARSGADWESHFTTLTLKVGNPR
ncbi:MAG: DUF4198 domain-containing protein [Thermoanaerobaculia bacterium]